MNIVPGVTTIEKDRRLSGSANTTLHVAGGEQGEGRLTLGTGH